jgi:hypothetical protein
MADTVTISAEVVEVADGNAIVEISYQVSDANLVRAFALDINVADGNIIDINNYFVGECNAAEQGYGIFPGTIQIDASGNVTDYGSPVAPGGSPGACGSLGTSCITIEMGSLYEDGNAPDVNGVLCRVKVDTVPNTLCIAEETAARGGIVMEDVAINPTVVTGCIAIAGEGCQCWGDVSGPEGTPDNLVSTSDMSALLIILNGYSEQGYSGPVPEGKECLDMSGPEGTSDQLLSTSDMSTLLIHLNQYADQGYSGPCIELP